MTLFSDDLNDKEKMYCFNALTPHAKLWVEKEHSDELLPDKRRKA